MNLGLVSKIVEAVLYEGYILYPYRTTSVKNRQRFNFGSLTPRSYSEAQGGTEAWSMQTEGLVAGDERAALDVRVRFLHPLEREVCVPVADGEYRTAAVDDGTSEDGESEFSVPDSDVRVVASLEVGGEVFQTWQETVEREVSLSDLHVGELVAQPRRLAFNFPASRKTERLRETGGQIAGFVIRRQQAVEGAVEVAAESMSERLFKITARVLNLTPLDDANLKSRDEALMRSLVSTHTILGARGGEFVSLLDPPEEFREAVAGCRNTGTWPVLVGDEGERDCMLSSPIILYDYPQIAPESAGELFDGTEIDEILTLRIMTLTDEEKREMRGTDERARRILERTETLPAEQLMKMHGAMRALRPKREVER